MARFPYLAAAQQSWRDRDDFKNNQLLESQLGQILKWRNCDVQ